MSVMNFAVIGYGGMGSYHVHTIMPKELIHVKGTYDCSEERQTISQEKGHFIYTTYEEVLNDQEIEAVLIATPNDSHKNLAIKALRAGKHVVCEKPVTLTTQEFEDILLVANETKKTFMVHQNRRWDPDFLIVRELYKTKQIGELFQIESRVQGANGIPGDWRHLKAHGGGMLLDWGVHLLDQLLFMIDSPIKSVAADFSYVLGDEVDDGVAAYLTFESGEKVIMEVGTTNFIKLPRWYIKGTDGTAVIEDWDLSGKMIQPTYAQDVSAPAPIQAGVGLTKTMAPPSEEATKTLDLPEAKAEYTEFYQNFYDVVRHQAEPIVKNEEVYRVLKLIETIFKAGETHQVLPFE